MSKVYNFNAGPAMLPIEVMEKAQNSFLNYENLGYGIMEASHRSSEFDEVIKKSESNVRDLLTISDDYAVLFLQGGASTQFAMIPMNFLSPTGTADYVMTGSWSEKALKEAKLFGEARIAASSEENNYNQIPDFRQWNLNEKASYLHITSNNTIFGTQYHTYPKTLDGVPLIADMSSDILSKRFSITDFGLVYAGAQKNLGPSGVTLVVIRKELATKSPSTLASMFNYNTHIKSSSLYNTPPTFAIYMLYLVTTWLLDKGGLEAVEQTNEKKAKILYDTIDQDEFFRCPAEISSRSYMNVCFRLQTEDLEKKFINEVVKEGMIGLKGHRSVGGLRASIYNAMPIEGVGKLNDVMLDFKRRYG